MYVVTVQCKECNEKDKPVQQVFVCSEENLADCVKDYSSANSVVIVTFIEQYK